MRAGTRFYTQEGVGALSRDTLYSFLKSDSVNGRILCVEFFEKENSIDARIVVVAKDMFEDAVDRSEIHIDEEQTCLPPWHENQNGRDVSTLDQGKIRRIKSNRDFIDQRLGYLASALRDLKQILGSSNPEKTINQYARACSPRQNEKRFRTWLLTYLCCGRNGWSLCPTFHRAGHWSRLTRKTKYGRPSKSKGCRSGFAMSEDMVNQSLEAYDRLACFGKKMTTIYAETLVKHFGCSTRLVGKRKREVYHPGGQPFPSFDQFRYRIIKKFGIEVVRKHLYGDARSRRTKGIDEGSFTEKVANLMERVEADGYFCEERPRGYFDGSTLDALNCVVLRDSLSGMKLGIGFSQGAERKSAYQMALFCAAVPKPFFCSLFGLKIKPEDWPSEGLPPHLIFDRGPGSALDLIPDFERKFPIRELAPSYSGQSKAIVESSHPRSTKKEGQPTFVESDKTPIELANQEIKRLILYNKIANMESRLHPHPRMVNVEPSPIGLWEYFDQRGRNDSQSMSVETAVRMFLTPVEAALRRDGVWLSNAQRYDSADLKQTPEFRKLIQTAPCDVKIKAWVMSFCVRHIWVELDGKLMLLTAKKTYRDDDGVHDLSLEDLAVWKEFRSLAQSEFRETAHAERVATQESFKQETGKSFDSGRRKTGRPKSSALVQRENKEAIEPKAKRNAA